MSKGQSKLSLITIDSIHQKANELMFQQYPLLGKNYIKRGMVQFVVKAIIELDKEGKE